MGIRACSLLSVIAMVTSIFTFVFALWGEGRKRSLMKVGSTGPGPRGGRGLGGDLFLRQVGLPGIHEVWDHLPGAPIVGGGGTLSQTDPLFIKVGGPFVSRPGRDPSPRHSCRRSHRSSSPSPSSSATVPPSWPQRPTRRPERERGGACGGGAPGPVVFPLLVGCSNSVG